MMDCMTSLIPIMQPAAAATSPVATAPSASGPVTAAQADASTSAAGRLGPGAHHQPVPALTSEDTSMAPCAAAPAATTDCTAATTASPVTSTAPSSTPAGTAPAAAPDTCAATVTAFANQTDVSVHLPGQQQHAARVAIDLAISMVMLDYPLTPAQLGHPDVACSIMALINQLATRCSFLQEVMGASDLVITSAAAAAVVSAYSVRYQGYGQRRSMKEWLQVMLRTCVLDPLESSSPSVQQNFMSAVTAMPNTELDFR